MGVFSISDLAISLTLFLNAAALLAYKSPPKITESDQSSSTSINNESIELLTPHNQKSEEAISIGRRFEVILEGIRIFSGVIVAWNVFFTFLLIFVFRG